MTLVTLVTKKLTVGAAFDGPFGESSPQEAPASARNNDNVRHIEHLLGSPRAECITHLCQTELGSRHSDELTTADSVSLFVTLRAGSVAPPGAPEASRR